MLRDSSIFPACSCPTISVSSPPLMTVISMLPPNMLTLKVMPLRSASSGVIAASVRSASLMIRRSHRRSVILEEGIHHLGCGGGLNRGGGSHFCLMVSMGGKILSFFFPPFRKMRPCSHSETLYFAVFRCISLYFAVFAVGVFGSVEKKMKLFSAH